MGPEPCDSVTSKPYNVVQMLAGPAFGGCSVVCGDTVRWDLGTRGPGDWAL